MPAKCSKVATRRKSTNVRHRAGHSDHPPGLRRADRRGRAARRSSPAARKLRVKLGLDPTAPDLHLGHTVVLNKLRAVPGARPPGAVPDRRLHRDDRRPHRQERHAPAADARARSWPTPRPTSEQVFKILDRERTRCCFNSEWSDKLGAEGMIRLAARYTVARMLERDDFEQALRERPADRGARVPVPAGAGLRLGRAEGRRRARRHRPEIQPAGGPRAAEATTGRSRSASSPCRCSKGSTASTRCPSRSATTSASTSRRSEMFGKLMSITDELMWRYIELLSFGRCRRSSAGRRKSTAGAIRATSKCASRGKSSRASKRGRCRRRAGGVRRSASGTACCRMTCPR